VDLGVLSTWFPVFFLIIYEKRGKKEIKSRMVQNGRSASAIRLKNSE
jgi:hypothetical protein